jgi:hypothetical protein
MDFVENTQLPGVNSARCATVVLSVVAVKSKIFRCDEIYQGFIVPAVLPIAFLECLSLFSYVVLSNDMHARNIRL